MTSSSSRPSFASSDSELRRFVCDFVRASHTYDLTHGNCIFNICISNLHNTTTMTQDPITHAKRSEIVTALGVELTPEQQHKEDNDASIVVSRSSVLWVFKVRFEDSALNEFRERSVGVSIWSHAQFSLEELLNPKLG